MSQIMSQILGQQMRLEQRLTPQLIQSMDILHLPAQALEQRIAEELERNVALELVELEKTDRAEAGGNGQDGQPSGDGNGADSFVRLERFSRENHFDISDDGYVPRRPRAPSGERDAKMDAMANTASRTEGLDEHLMQQWVLLDLDNETRRAGEEIIYHLDDDGYLRTPLEQIAESADPPLSVEQLESALSFVQKLDPVGIAARNYKECLLLQLDTLPGDNTIERELIQNHLDDVAKNRYPVIARKTGYSIGEISAAVDAIRRSLILHPGYLVVDRRVPRVYPDVVVEQAPGGKSLIVRLTRGNMPDLRIKTDYAQMLKDRSNGKDVRDFVRKQVEDANSLIEAVRFRKSRLAERTLVYSTHNLAEVDELCTDLVVLREGCVVAARSVGTGAESGAVLEGGCFTLRTSGAISEEVLAAIDGLELLRARGTVVSVRIASPAALDELVERIRGAGLGLLELRPDPWIEDLLGAGKGAAR